MLDSLAEIASTFGPIILAGMGVIVSVMPNIARSRERWSWVGAFFITGLIVSLANYYELHSTNVMQKESWERTTGGDGYCYVDIFDKIGENQWSIAVVNPGDFPLPSIKMDINRIDKKKDDELWREVTVIPMPFVGVGKTKLDYTVRPGLYEIKISIRNGQIFEKLDVNPSEKVRGSRRLIVVRFRNGGQSNERQFDLLVDEDD